MPAAVGSTTTGKTATPFVAFLTAASKLGCLFLTWKGMVHPVQECAEPAA